jgi:hypothetical protein
MSLQEGASVDGFVADSEPNRFFKVKPRMRHTIALKMCRGCLATLNNMPSRGSAHGR